MGTQGPPSREYFDRWYAQMLGSPVKDSVKQRHLGLPPELLSTSPLSWDAIAEVVDSLRLSVGSTLLDLACGRGGYGLEVSGRTGARLVGVDFSAQAVHQATEQARRLGRAADFRVGDLAATGLESGSVDAILCVDAIQFAERPADVYRELRRVLAPGGRVVLTCWEAITRDDDRVPERLREVDLMAGLTAGGFDEIEVRDRPDWQTAERAMWEEAAALDPNGDPALQSFHEEGLRALTFRDFARRMLASGTAPPESTLGR